VDAREDSDATSIRAATYSTCCGVKKGIGGDGEQRAALAMKEMKNFSVRTAVLKDAGAIAQGERETAKTAGLLVGKPGEISLGAYSAKIEALTPLGSYWVAQVDHVVVGHACLDPMTMAANAHVFRLNIVVYPDHRTQGIGTALMLRMLAWSQSCPSLEKIELLVRASNQPAILLYRKFGFIEEGRLSRRVRTSDGTFIDDISMAWFPANAKRLDAQNL
jgi:L-amino acid N-acyltransferase YncA